MQDITDEFSFILKSSKHGVGVFAARDIKKGTYLRMFGDEEAVEDRVLARAKKNVPEAFRPYCVVNENNVLICPKNFSCMPIGWYLNHSKSSNAVRDEQYRWYAARDLKAGEEITIDYNSLEEPEEAKEGYYLN